MFQVSIPSRNQWLVGHVSKILVNVPPPWSLKYAKIYVCMKTPQLNHGRKLFFTIYLFIYLFIFFFFALTLVSHNTHSFVLHISTVGFILPFLFVVQLSLRHPLVGQGRRSYCSCSVCSSQHLSGAWNVKASESLNCCHHCKTC